MVVCNRARELAFVYVSFITDCSLQNNIAIGLGFLIKDVKYRSSRNVLMPLSCVGTSESRCQVLCGLIAETNG
jgi:hypothetical protein